MLCRSPVHVSLCAVGSRLPERGRPPGPAHPDGPEVRNRGCNERRSLHLAHRLAPGVSLTPCETPRTRRRVIGDRRWSRRAPRRDSGSCALAERELLQAPIRIAATTTGTTRVARRSVMAASVPGLVTSTGHHAPTRGLARR